MIDLVLLQSISYIVAAIGVFAAAIYYIMILRATNRNSKIALETRKLQLITYITQNLQNEEGCRRYAEMMNMEWKDYDEFEKKYGSDFNINNYANRTTAVMSYNMLGALLREKLIEPETLYNVGLVGSCFIWNKFEDVINEARMRYMGEDWLQDFELLANEMMRIKMLRNPSYKIPETLTKYIPEE